jgi:hypothetical protein
MRRFMLLAMVTGVALTTLARPAMAATKTPFTAVAVYDTFGDPERQWYSDGVLHIRGQLISGTITGDLEGTISIVINLNINEDGSNEQWGTFVITTLEVTYEGTFQSGNGETGTFRGEGNDGTSLTQGRFFNDEESHIEGIILDPHG